MTQNILLQRTVVSRSTSEKCTKKPKYIMKGVTILATCSLDICKFLVKK